MSVDPHALVEQGFEVFPVRISNPGTSEKELHMLMKGDWGGYATRDHEQVDQWISQFGRKITDWCLPTGHRNGFVAVDIDSPEAEQWWSAQWMPPGKEVTTPRGGLHIYYSVDGMDFELKTGTNNPRDNIDTRGEGGFVVAYASDMSDIPQLPDGVMEILPERQQYNTHEAPDGAVPLALATVTIPSGGESSAQVSPSEARSLKGLLDILDNLPKPWHEGAGYHSAQFMVACALNRIANSPYYHTTREQALGMFLQHAPLRNQDDIPVRQKRWDSAVEAASGQWFDPPTDVPLRLEADTIIDRFTKFGSVDRLYWSSRTIGEVKDLIRELREAGATAQEAYSISWSSGAMNKIRERNGEHSGSTWGFVKDIYNLDTVESEQVEVVAPPSASDSEVTDFSLLETWERDLVRNYPSFIDRYIMVAQELLAEPNMPLHYVNAWMALSCIVGDRGDIMLTNGRRPLSFFAMPLADSAAGKGDAKNVLKMVVNSCRRGGFGDINAGGSASAEGLTDFVSEREGKVVLFNKDESSSLLDAMHREGSFESKMMTLALDLYDGEANQNLRVGNAKDGVGGSIKTSFNMWLQTTWAGAVESLTEKDIGTGFVGRYLVAIGNDAVITDESLRPQLASEYQVELGGVHPMIKSMSDGMNAVIGRVKNITIEAGDDVLDRYVKMRKDVLAAIASHPRASVMRGIMLRVTDNMFKGAAMLAISEGRSRMEMTDLLLAIKSGQYWARDALRLSDAVSKSIYRRNIDAVIMACERAPRGRGYILSMFQNVDGREVMGFVERAEQEGSIKKTEDGKRWVAVERE